MTEVPSVFATFVDNLTIVPRKRIVTFGECATKCSCGGLLGPQGLTLSLLVKKFGTVAKAIGKNHIVLATS